MAGRGLNQSRIDECSERVASKPPSANILVDAYESKHGEVVEKIRQVVVILPTLCQ